MKQEVGGVGEAGRFFQRAVLAGEGGTAAVGGDGRGGQGAVAGVGIGPTWITSTPIEQMPDAMAVSSM